MAKKEKALAIGMEYVGYAPYLDDGAVASALTEIEDVHAGSVAFNFADPTEVKINVERLDDPRWILNQKGDVDSVELAIASPSSEEMKAFCGGEVEAGKWSEPLSIPSINMSLKMRTKPYKGQCIEYVIINGSVSAKLSQAPGKEQTDLLLIKVKKQAVITSEGVVKPSFSREVKDVVVTPPSGS